MSRLGLTDDGFLVMTGHVVEPDAVSVEIIENSQADLVTLSVVWLGELHSETSSQSDKQTVLSLS